jgi:hypothetical protein
LNNPGTGALLETIGDNVIDDGKSGVLMVNLVSGLSKLVLSKLTSGDFGAGTIGFLSRD